MEKQDLLGALYKAAPIGIAFVDKNLRFVYANRVLAEIDGLTPEAYPGRTLEDLVPHLAPKLRPLYESVLHTGKPAIEMEIDDTNPDKTERRTWLASYFPVHDHGREVVGVGIIVQDITKRKNAQQALKDSEERYRAFIANSREAIWRFELEEPIPIGLPVDEQIGLCYERCYLAECNDAMAQMYGFEKASDIIGARMSQLLVPTVPKNIEYLRAFFYSGYRLIDAESEEPDKEGRIHYFLNSLIGIVENEKVYRAWGVQRDITERKLAEKAVEESRQKLAELNKGLEEQISVRTQELHRKEEELFQSRKLEAVGRLAGGVAHDFNNLVAGMLGLAEEMRSSLPPDDSRKEDLDAIINAGNRAFGVTRQLLAFGRRQIAQPKILDINEVVRDVTKLLGRLIGEDIKLELHLEATRPIEIDPGHMSQILMNLGINSRDAMPKGGTLRIRSFDAPGPYVALEIQDTGKGMEPETLTHVFEPFFTTKEKEQGTGLGLATVYGIVKQAGGDIQVKSQPGQGTTFKIFFPPASQATHKQSKSAPEQAPAHENTILVVEDEEIVRRFVMKRLSKEGFKVLLADNGHSALNLFRQNVDKIDLVVTDVVMPEMNGRDLVEELRKSKPNVHVLYMSGYPREFIAHRGVLEPGINFIDKSALNDKLLEKVREIVHP